jgi:alpha-galactosidase
MLKTYFSVLLLLSSPLLVFAQGVSVHFDAGAKVFRIDGGNASYVFGVNARGELQHLYWGGRLGATDSFPQARPLLEVGVV